MKHGREDSKNTREGSKASQNAATGKCRCSFVKCFVDGGYFI